MTRRWRRRDHGAGTVEMVILVPVLAALLSSAIAFGRVASARTAVDAASYAAARAASLQRSASAANAASGAAAAGVLSANGVTCHQASTVTDTSQFARPVGTPAVVTVDVSCTVTLADLLIDGMPGATTITSRAVSPVDSFRGRS